MCAPAPSLGAALISMVDICPLRYIALNVGSNNSLRRSLKWLAGIAPEIVRIPSKNHPRVATNNRGRDDRLTRLQEPNGHDPYFTEWWDRVQPVPFTF